jgi:hypothetical protein
VAKREKFEKQDCNQGFRNVSAPEAILSSEVEAGRPVSAWVAQLVERVLGKDEVTGSIPVPGSSFLLQNLKLSRRGGIAKLVGNERG